MAAQRASIRPVNRRSVVIPLVTVLAFAGLSGFDRETAAATTAYCDGGTGVAFAPGQSGTYVVPTGIHSVSIDASGGSGGSATGSEAASGSGADVTSNVPVTPGDHLTVDVGTDADGASGGESGGAPSGGAGGASDGEGGGGASVVKDGATTLVVAGGGGGAGAATVGSGVSAGGDGHDHSSRGDNAAAGAVSDGDAGQTGQPAAAATGADGGGGGTTTPGLGGTATSGGTSGQAGSGSTGGGGSPFGGGGGGGYLGGGGGGDNASYGAGGGAGSSYSIAPYVINDSATAAIDICYGLPQISTDDNPGLIGDTDTSATFYDLPTNTYVGEVYGTPVPTVTETGTLPGGVSLTQDGTGAFTLTGSPIGDTSGAYPITIVATNPNGTASLPFTIHVTKLTPDLSASAFVSSGDTPVYGQTITLQTMISGNYPDEGSYDADPAPTGEVNFSVDGTSPAACQNVVVQGHAGVDYDRAPYATASCTIASPAVPGTSFTVSYSGDQTFDAADPVTEPITVDKGPSTTTAANTSTALTATVGSSESSTASHPTGSVSFAVDGNTVGTANLAGGAASLPYVLTTGSHTVTATYSGDSNYLTSTDSETLSGDDQAAPTISASATSTHSKTKFGWYRTPVTVAFRCSAGTAPLKGSCPAPITLSKNAAKQTISRTVTATDGTTATATVKDINIDRVAPTVHAKGVTNGKIYQKAPTITCVGADSLSGLASCTVTTHRHKKTVRYTVTATDKAGNRTTATGTYHLR